MTPEIIKLLETLSGDAQTVLIWYFVLRNGVDLITCLSFFYTAIKVIKMVCVAFSENKND